MTARELNAPLTHPHEVGVSVAPPRADANDRAALMLAMFWLAILFGTATLGYLSYTFVLLCANACEAGAPVPYFELGISLLGISFCGRMLVMWLVGGDGYVRDQRDYPKHPIEWPFVSILVPAYNESDTIDPALESLRHLDYPCFEVIVVDDGSKDDTYAKAQKHEGAFGNGTLRAFSKPNAGKWSAHNFGFQHCRGEFIHCLDADSRIDPDSLKRLVARMTDPCVDAVCGYVRVRNRNNLLLNCQALEYIYGHASVRIPQSANGTVLCIPGPLGLFRRAVLEECCGKATVNFQARKDGEVAGPFQSDTLAEDFDLTLSILSADRRVVFEPFAVSHTKAPPTMLALINQRYRWSRGTLQALRKYAAEAVRNPRVRHVRLIGWLLATYVYDIVTFPLGFFAFVLALSMLFSSGPTGQFYTYFICFAAMSSMRMVSYWLSILIFRDDWRLVFVAFVMEWYQMFALTPALVIALIDEVRGSPMRW